jgi:hypothetical protein
MKNSDITVILHREFPSALLKIMKQEADLVKHRGSFVISASSYSFDHPGFLSVALSQASAGNKESNNVKPLTVLIALNYVLAVFEGAAEKDSLGFRP